MRAWQISAFGLDSLEFVELPTPAPGPGEVLIGVRAVSINYRDLMMVKGLYNPKMKLPRIPCSDGAGEVVAIGPGVTAWKPGDRVAAIFMQNWLDGPSINGVPTALAKLLAMKEGNVSATPPELNRPGTVTCCASR